MVGIFSVSSGISLALATGLAGYNTHVVGTFMLNMWSQMMV